MEYHESRNYYFQSDFVFSTMYIHRDPDKLPADVEELIQPAALEEAVAFHTGEGPPLQRGAVSGGPGGHLRNGQEIRRAASLGWLTRVTLPANSSTADVIVARRAVQAEVLDTCTLHGGAAGFVELPCALAVPTELLAHEDFVEVLLDGEAYSVAPRSATC